MKRPCTLITICAFFCREDYMKASDTELKQEIDQIKKRVSSLEKAFDSVLTKDDSEAIDEARQDLAHGRTVALSEVKKKRS